MGRNVWLKRQILNRLGEQGSILLGASRAYGNQRYEWLLQQMGDEQLIADYLGWDDSYVKVLRYLDVCDRLRSLRIFALGLVLRKEQVNMTFLLSEIDDLEESVNKSKVHIKLLYRKYGFDLEE